MTGQDVFDSAIALIDQVGEDTADYQAKAVSLLNTLQHDIAGIEGVTETEITALTDDISLTSDEAQNALKYGLASMFALHDMQDALYVALDRKYNAALVKIKSTDVPITDEFSTLDGLS